MSIIDTINIDVLGELNISTCTEIWEIYWKFTKDKFQNIDERQKRNTFSIYNGYS